MNKTVTILGSTGSIGKQTLEAAAHLGLKIKALSVYQNIELLEEQIQRFNPEAVAVYDEDAAKILENRLKASKTHKIPNILKGKNGQIKLAGSSGADVIVTAIAGQAGLEPTIAAIKTGNRIALANKEPLVCDGENVIKTAKKYGAEIIPVDSEHSAIFQCLQNRGRPQQNITSQQKDQPQQGSQPQQNYQPQQKEEYHPVNANTDYIKKIILTASGGPFFGKSKKELKNITPEQALKHPNWSMGKKITIDSATLMNKGLELIEAMHLFDIEPDKIEVLIHPESIIHSMVEFFDGSVIAQLSNPDMRQPIQYALTYPDRRPSLTKPLDLTQIGKLTFKKPDFDAFPCLRLAYEAAKKGTKACAALNEANEKAVALFLDKKIGFNDIPKMIEEVLCT